LARAAGPELDGWQAPFADHPTDADRVQTQAIGLLPNSQQYTLAYVCFALHTPFYGYCENGRIASRYTVYTRCR